MPRSNMAILLCPFEPAGEVLDILGTQLRQHEVHLLACGCDRELMPLECLHAAEHLGESRLSARDLEAPESAVHVHDPSRLPMDPTGAHEKDCGLHIAVCGLHVLVEQEKERRATSTEPPP